MIVRRLAFVSVWLCILAAPASAQVAFDGNKILHWCESDRFTLSTFVMGSLDASEHAWRVMNSLDPKEDSSLRTAQRMVKGYCAPGEATVPQVIEVFCAYVKSNPEVRAGRASRLLRDSMVKKWPCP